MKSFTLMKNEKLRCGEGLATFIFLGCFVFGFSVQRGESSCGIYIVCEKARRGEVLVERKGECSDGQVMGSFWWASIVCHLDSQFITEMGTLRKEVVSVFLYKN